MTWSIFFQTFTRQFTHKTSLLPNNLHNFFADRTVHTTKAEEFWDAGIVVIPRCDDFIVWKRTKKVQIWVSVIELTKIYPITLASMEGVKYDMESVWEWCNSKWLCMSCESAGVPLTVRMSWPPPRTGHHQIPATQNKEFDKYNFQHEKHKRNRIKRWP